MAIQLEALDTARQGHYHYCCI